MPDVQTQTIQLYRGEEWVGDFTATTATGISNWTLVMTFAEKAGDAALVTLTVGDGLTVTAPGTGGFRAALTAEQTADLEARPSGYYVWDVWRTDAGYETRLAGGVLLVLEPVLQPA